MMRTSLQLQPVLLPEEVSPHLTAHSFNQASTRKAGPHLPPSYLARAGARSARGCVT